MQVLKFRSVGRDVEKLQAALNKAKAKPALTVDGKYGKNTEAAVAWFQKKERLLNAKSRVRKGVACGSTQIALGLIKAPNVPAWPFDPKIHEESSITFGENAQVCANTQRKIVDTIRKLEEAARELKRYKDVMRRLQVDFERLSKDALSVHAELSLMHSYYEEYKKFDPSRAAATVKEANAVYARSLKDFTGRHGKLKSQYEDIRDSHASIKNISFEKADYDTLLRPAR